MARKVFNINNTPHEIVIGDTELLMQPEVIGSEFASAYAELSGVQKLVADAGDDGVDPAALEQVSAAMRAFLSSFMLPESIETFAGMRLPDRILVQMLEHVAELYGGGSKERPTGQSSGS